MEDESLLVTYEDVYNAFFPAIEIRDAGNFVGRKKELAEGIKSLQNKGSVLTIIGQRGVGKTSIACQIANIAAGDTSLLEKSGLQKCKPRKGFKYRVFKYELDRSVTNIGDLLSFMLQGDCKENSLRLAAGLDKKLSKSSSKDEISAMLGVPKLFQLGGKGAGTKEYQHEKLESLSLEFRYALKELTNYDESTASEARPIAIIIDEFDLVDDKDGFGSLLKACASDKVKFVLVGVASSISELMKDHASIARKKEVLHIDRMVTSDLDGIIFNAERRLKDGLKFDQDVINGIVDNSDGFPYFAQLMGQNMAINAIQSERNRVTSEDYDHFFQTLKSNKLDSLYSDMYHEIVEAKEKRPPVVIAASLFLGETFSTQEIRQTNPDFSEKMLRSVLNELTKPVAEYSPIMHRVRLDNYRFIDPLFKAYCRLYSVNRDSSMTYIDPP